MTGMHMHSEIHEQPALLEALATRTEPAHLAAQIRRREPAVIQILARGTSGYVGVYAKYLIEASTGIPVAIITPSVTTLANAAPWSSRSVVLAISQSGESPDLIACLESARSHGAFTATLSNSPESTLARIADVAIDFGAGPEIAVAATKSYVTSALLVAQLAAGLAGEQWEFGALAGLAARHLEQRATVEEASSALTGARAVVTLGRGFTFANAREAALKLTETCSIPAQGFSSAEFMHGPIAALAPDVVTLHLPSGLEAAASVADLHSALAARGGPVLAWTPSPIDARIAPIVDIIPLQLLALTHARSLGANPDAPASLSKATSTL